MNELSLVDLNVDLLRSNRSWHHHSQENGVLEMSTFGMILVFGTAAALWLSMVFFWQLVPIFKFLELAIATITTIVVIIAIIAIAGYMIFTHITVAIVAGAALIAYAIYIRR